MPTLEKETMPVGAAPKLSHLQMLEAESIHIFREVAAEFEKPVMLYSIGKDSSVMLRLAQKAFYPGPIPFPLLHVDTGYKFREMIAFRDDYTRQLGVELLVWRNEAATRGRSQSGCAGNATLLRITQDHGAARWPARPRLRRRLRRSPPGRRKIPRQGAYLFLPR